MGLIFSSIFFISSAFSEVTDEMAGVASVSPSGAAIYTIPIEVPKSLGGLKPIISFQYNSQSRRVPYPTSLTEIRPEAGTLGKGWSVSGLSVITRCPTDLTRDGLIDAVDYDGNDQYCLDGKRLVLVNGIHGISGAEYRTEMNGFNKVVALGVEGNKLKSFKMWQKDGRVVEYGLTSNSRQEEEETSEISRWNISSIKNSVGNEISFLYFKNVQKLIYRIDKITYEDKEVLFKYHPEGYVHENWIHKVEINQSGVLKEFYEIGYAYNYSGLELGYTVDNVMKCLTGYVCMSPIVFNWGSKNIISFGKSTQEGPTSVGNHWSNAYRIKSGDFDGDGTMDIYQAKGSNTTEKDRIWLSDGAGGFKDTGAVGPLTYIGGGTSHTTNTPAIRDMSRIKFGDFNGDGLTDVYHVLGNDRSVSITDRPMIASTHDNIWLSNGDGTFIDTNSNGPLTRVDSTVTGGKLDISRVKFGDFDGDGRTDIYYVMGWGGAAAKDNIWFSHGDGSFRTKTPAGSVTGPATHVRNSIEYQAPIDISRIHIADFNGDGMDDVYRINDGKDSVWISNGDGTFKAGDGLGASTIIHEAHSSILGHRVRFGDFNGDGRTDVYHFQDRRYGLANDRIWFAKPDGSFDTSYIDILDNVIVDDMTRVNLVDFNGDGLMDIYIIKADNNSTDLIKLSYGNGTFKNVAINSVFEGSFDSRNYSHLEVLMGDFTGNGVPDIYRTIPGRNGEGVFNLYSDSRIEGATKSIGQSYFFEYADSAGFPTYKRGNTNPEYPIRHISPKNLVSKIETDDGLGGKNSNEYYYSGMLFNHRGLGNLGFKSVSKYDPFSRIHETADYLQDYESRKIGIPTKKWTYITGGAIPDGNGGTEYTKSRTLNVTDYYWDIHTLPEEGVGEGYNERFRRYLGYSRIKKYNLAGTNISETKTLNCDANSYDAKDFCTQYSYDEYGNAKYSKQTIIDYQASGNKHTTISENEYWDKNSFTTDESAWFVSQAKVSKLTKSGYGSDLSARLASESHITEYPEYTTAGQQQKVIEEPGVSEKVTHYEYDDVYGRPTKETISGRDFSSRVSNYNYNDANPYLVTKTQDAGNGVIHKTVTEFDSFFGKPLTVEDSNGLFTIYSYEDFGRLSTRQDPDGTLTTKKYLWCSIPVTPVCNPYGCTKPATNSCPRLGVSYVVSTFEDSLSKNSSEVIYDKFNRKVLEQYQGFDGSWIVNDYGYDARGREIRVSKPYFSGANEKFSTITTEFDILNRPIKKTLANGYPISVDYDGFDVTVYDAKNQKRRALKNAWGEVILTADDNGKEQSFTHDAWGNLLFSIESDENTVGMTYDIRGNKLSLNDPDTGNWKYGYNALSELVLQTDAKDQATCMAYDNLGRMTKRIDLYSGTLAQAKDGCSNDTANLLTSVWTYDTAIGNAIGNVHTVSGENDYSESYSYDNLGRLNEKSTTIDGLTYLSGATYYPNSSRTHLAFYPKAGADNFAIQHSYNSFGYLNASKDAMRNTPFYSVEAMDARGNVTEFTLGNNTKTIKNFFPDTGYADSIDTTRLGTSFALQSLSYDFDPVGNLRYREDLTVAGGLSEIFVYDNLNRVTDSSVYGKTTKIEKYEYTLDGLGNLNTKTGVGAYTYGLLDNSSCTTKFAGPHAVTRVSGGTVQSTTDYCYDANGSMVSGNGQQVEYTAFNKPSLMGVDLANKVEFNYGPGRQKLQRMDTKNAIATTTTYVGDSFERIANGEEVTYKYYLGNYAVITKKGDLTTSPFVANYIHRDHLGSVDNISNECGMAIAGENQSFDAWGARRHGDWESAFDQFSFESSVSTRGYTDHEHIDALGLIHMKGRVYNPVIGRFLSADPIVQFPYNGQSYNRYSYVLNNGLSYTDPTGYTAAGQGDSTTIAIDTSFDTGGMDSMIANSINSFGLGAGGSQSFGGLIHLPEVCQGFKDAAIIAPMVPNRLAGFALTVLNAPAPISEITSMNWLKLTPQQSVDMKAFRESSMVLGYAVALIGMRKNAAEFMIDGVSSVRKTADAALAAGKNRGAAAHLDVNGQTFKSVSGNNTDLDSKLQNALDTVPGGQRSPTHGHCAEMGCINQALKSGVDPSGGNMTTVAIGKTKPGHGIDKPACSSCSHVMHKFGINN